VSVRAERLARMYRALFGTVGGVYDGVGTRLGRNPALNSQGDGTVSEEVLGEGHRPRLLGLWALIWAGAVRRDADKVGAVQWGSVAGLTGTIGIISRFQNSTARSTARHINTLGKITLLRCDSWGLS